MTLIPFFFFESTKGVSKILDFQSTFSSISFLSMYAHILIYQDFPRNNALKVTFLFTSLQLRHQIPIAPTQNTTIRNAFEPAQTFASHLINIPLFEFVPTTGVNTRARSFTHPQTSPEHTKSVNELEIQLPEWNYTLT